MIYEIAPDYDPASVDAYRVVYWTQVAIMMGPTFALTVVLASGFDAGLLATILALAYLESIAAFSV